MKKKDKKTSSIFLIGTLACFVLIAVYGITTQLKVSYAFPNAFDEIDSSKITQIKSTAAALTQDYLPEESPSGENAWKSMHEKFTGSATVNTTTYNLDMFCLEIFKDVPFADDNVTYERQNDSVDEAITSIIISAYNKANVDKTDNTVTISLKNEDYYDAQMAIWIYQNMDLLNKNEITIADVTGADDEEKQANLNNIKALQRLWKDISKADGHNKGHAKIIYDYVANAIDAKTIDTKNTVQLKGQVELKLTSDKKYYETGLLEVEITTASNTELNKFIFTTKTDNKDVDVEIIDENGNVITDYSQLQSKKFKIRLDASKLPSNSTTNITGDLQGIFRHVSFKKYKATEDGWQIALLVASDYKDESVPLKLSVTVPDTGLGSSLYIYIIGALVLIVGMTIIYVNTKVQEN